MNTKKIETLVYDTYCEKGFASACDEANKHECVGYEVCEFCAISVPTINGDHICLICGFETVAHDSDNENISIENN